MPDLLKAALAYAERGWPCFPVRSDKTPFTQAGVLDATTDPKQIEEWWKLYPSANIGFDVGSARMMALDLDPGADKASLEKLVGPVNTKLRTKTPRGGEHLFFALSPDDPPIAPSASKIAPHVDVRSFHSYVLLPPSRTDKGSYEWVEEGIPKYRSSEMVRLASAAKEKSKDRDRWLIEADLPDNIESASIWLMSEKARPAIEGLGGDAMCYATAAMMKGYGISEALALDLMLQYWWPKCVSSNDDPAGYLETKISNAYEHNTSPPGKMCGGYKAALAADLFKPVEKILPSGREVISGRYRFVDEAGMAHIRPPEWLVPDFLPQGGYATIFGPPSSYKSFIALDIALTIASGMAIDPVWADTSPGMVLYTLGEGRPEFGRRVAAWKQAHHGNAPVPNFILGDPVPRASEHDKLEAFLNGALELSPDGYKLVVIDTIGRSMQGLNENAQEDASQFTQLVETIQRELGATVLALHHTGHGSKDRERGSMVFRADADTAVRIDKEDHARTVELCMVKQKDAAEWSQPKKVTLREVTLVQGKSLVAVKPTPSDSAPKEPQGKFDKTMSAGVTLLVDGAISRVLQAVAGRVWGTKELAQAVAMEPSIDIGSKVVERHMVKARETKGTYASGAFDPLLKSKKWRAPASA